MLKSAREELRQFFKNVVVRNLLPRKFRKKNDQLIGLGESLANHNVSIVTALHTAGDQGHHGTLLGHDLIQHAATEGIGRTILARSAIERDFPRFASDLLLPLSFADILERAPQAIAVLANEDSGRFIALVDYILMHSFKLENKVLVDTLSGLLQLRDFERYKLLCDQSEKQLESLSGPSIERYLSLKEWIKKASFKSKPLQKRTHELVEIGLLSYKTPDGSSTNVGDYIQTIAMLGQVIQGIKSIPMLEAYDQPSAIRFDTATKRVADHLKVERRNYSVKLYQVDRDDPSTQTVGRSIWLPVFGWFAHKKFGNDYDFAFKNGYKPLFISVHINQPEILTPSVISMLTACQPIGCRDYQTVRLLKSHGIVCFFSGCVTTTLGQVFKKNTKFGLKIFASHHKKTSFAPFHKFVAHSLNSVMTDPFVVSLNRAVDYLERIAQCSHIITPLLHCYLPARAIGVAVKFKRKRMSDRRFEGLIDASEVELKAMSARISKVQEIFAKIARRHSEHFIRQEWARIWADDVLQTDSYLKRLDDALVVAPGDTLLQNALQNIRVSTLKKKSDVIQSSEKTELHICFSIDANVLAPFVTTLRSVVENTKNEVHLHVFTRGCSNEDLKNVLRRVRLASVTQYDFDAVDYGKLKLLSHTTVATMDRLLAPECIRDLDKVLYLDVDVLVRKDILDLWSKDLGDYPLAARESIQVDWKHGSTISNEVAEKYPPKMAQSIRSYISKTGPVEFRCFNAGVLLMNLARMRDDKFSETALSLAKSFGFHDQYILNLYTRNNFLSLPEVWNHFPTQEFVNDPSLVHFIGPSKPWNSRSYRFSNEWRSYQSE